MRNTIIRPISELRNNFAEISRLAHETKQPIFLTKNGYGSLVVMSLETYDDEQFDQYLTTKIT